MEIFSGQEKMVKKPVPMVKLTSQPVYTSN